MRQEGIVQTNDEIASNLSSFLILENVLLSDPRGKQIVLAPATHRLISGRVVWCCSRLTREAECLTSSIGTRPLCWGLCRRTRRSTLGCQTPGRVVEGGH